MVGHDQRRPAWDSTDYDVSGRIGHVEVHDLWAKRGSFDRHGQAERRRGEGQRPRGFDHLHAIVNLTRRIAISIRDQYRDVLALGCLCFGQHFDVIFDTADDRIVIFVDVENAQIGLLTPAEL
jgi:hypothetical protein